MLLDTTVGMERSKKILQPISEDTKIISKIDTHKNSDASTLVEEPDQTVPQNQSSRRRLSQQQLQKPWSAFEVAKAISVLGAGTGVGIATVTVTTIVATVFIFVMLVVFVFFVLRNVAVGCVTRLKGPTQTKRENRIRRNNSNNNNYTNNSMTYENYDNFDNESNSAYAVAQRRGTMGTNQGSPSSYHTMRARSNLY